MDDTQGKFVTGADEKEILKKFQQTRTLADITLAELKERIEKKDGLFHVRETIEIRGSRFRVQAINPRGMRLKLLPREKK